MNSTELCLPWHREQWGLFTSYLKQDKVPQALLIAGQHGLGKQLLATQFAQSLLCIERNEIGLYCGLCQSCKLFGAKSHPDFFLIQPVEPGKDISINQIRELIARLSLKPQYESYRVVVINPADTMNNASANGFLKCLEEPTERTVIILISDRPTCLPVTIRSRCQIINIHCPNQHEAVDWLNSQKISGNPEALLAVSHGAPLLARQNQERNTLEHRKNCFTEWLKLVRNHADPISVAEEWNQYSPIELISWMLSWVMDLIKYKNQVETGFFYNPDLQQTLQVQAQRLELIQLFDFYDLLLLTRQRIDTQLNKQLLLEELLIHWSLINNKI